MYEFLAFSTIKGNPCSISTVWGNSYLKNLKILKMQLTKKTKLLIQELTFNSTPAGTTIGLNDKEWGQMGVTIIAGTDGCIIEAPAATA